jgi:dephospho-CoA kinase
MSEHPPLLVGLTGGIASGKSLVAKLFAERGTVVIDTDQLAREVVAPGTSGLEKVRAEFGNEVIAADGSLDRATVRRRVFNDPALRGRLEAILHPLILDALATASDEAGGLYQVLVIPLLVESGLESRVDRVLVVDCSEAEQIARLMARDGETREGARRILAAQADRASRLSVAHDVIVNEGSRAGLEPLVERLDRYYRELAESGDFSASGMRLP